MQPASWNELVARLPGAHVLQTWEWGQVKARWGWQPLPVIWRAGPGGIHMQAPAQPDDLDTVVAAALVLKRTLSLGGFAARVRMLYAPKGPLLDWSNGPLRDQVLHDLGQLARREGAFFIKIDPDVPLGRGIPGTAEAQELPAGQALAGALHSRGWLFSNEQVQFRNTVEIDLSQPVDEMLARMKQKTRYNIRLAERKGVQVRPGTRADLPLLFSMYVETSLRDGFTIREEGYYQSVWQTFMAASMAEPWIAEVAGEPVAAVFLFHLSRRAWYLYGMSRQAHREKMPNHLLQWQAILRAKELGCQVYDLWGAPDHFDETDSMWGVYRFKEGLGGVVVRTPGAWDLPVRPWLYRLYTQTLPHLLSWMRRRGDARTRTTLQ